MKIDIILLVIVSFVLGIMFHGFVIPKLRADAIASLLEAEKKTRIYATQLEKSTLKFNWIKEDMSGDNGLLQAIALRKEVDNLRSLHDQSIKYFDKRYKWLASWGLVPR